MRKWDKGEERMNDNVFLTLLNLLELLHEEYTPYIGECIFIRLDYMNWARAS